MPDQMRDFSSVSPSAKSLLLMKGETNIPYARQTANLMKGPEIFDLDFERKDMYFWLRVMHFESRYWSIDQLLQKTDSKNILELSSGYSMRGLDMCTREDVHYIDTDLPDVIDTKQQMINELGLGKDLRGKLTFQPLNALDKAAFESATSQFDDQAVTIVNEGLLMYLNTDEKKRLCGNIRDILEKNGGCWITADVYPRRSANMKAAIPQSESEIAFHEQHQIEENKFSSFEDARIFFNEQGFEISEEANVDFTSLSVIPKLMKVLPPEVLKSKEPPPKIQSTWKLELRKGFGKK